ncbi:MAG TPA: DNA repair protein RecO [Nitrospirota bacterium]|jgi:DNA repair protein RecO (recombination protein O)
MQTTISTRAVVLNATAYGDSDLIVSLLTEEHGLVKGMAKGARKSRKRFAGCFEPFTLIRVSARVKDPSMLARIESAEILDPRLKLREDLGRIEAGAMMLELSAIFEEPGLGNMEVFELLNQSLKILESSSDILSLSSVFLVKLLTSAGYAVPVSECPGCGVDFAGRAGHYRGGHELVCEGCGKGSGESMKVSAGTLAFIRQAASMELEKVGRLRLLPSARQEVFSFIGAYLEAVSGKRPKALAKIASDA